MAGLTAALEGLAGEDLFGCGAPELLDRTRALVAARNRLEAELARTVRRGELAQAPEHDGLTTMASWLRGHAHLSGVEAGRVVRNGRALEQLPALAAAHAAGRVSAEQVAVVEPITRPDNRAAAAERGVDLAEIDRVLAGLATERPHAELRMAVHRHLAWLDQDGPEPDPTEGRTLRLATHPDGHLSFRGDLDPVGGEKLQTALEALVQAGRAAGEERSRAQQLADALVQLCDNALAAGALPMLRTVKPHVIVRVDLADLAGSATGPAAAETGFGATISAARARWIACDAGITRIVLGPDGVPLDLGREHRLVSSHLRRAVEARDRGCVFTGCSAPTHWCDVHHLLEWINGGATSLENSALLRERHHTKVHHGFRLARQPDGRWRTWRPDGTEIRTGPDLLHAA